MGAGRHTIMAIDTISTLQLPAADEEAQRLFQVELDELSAGLPSFSAMGGSPTGLLADDGQAMWLGGEGLA